jgi:hypothetical protein
MVALSKNHDFIDRLAVECWTAAGIERERAQSIVGAGRRLVHLRNALITHLEAIGDNPTEAQQEQKQELCRLLEQAGRDVDEAVAPVKPLMEEAVRKHGATLLVEPQPWPLSR